MACYHAGLLQNIYDTFATKFKYELKMLLPAENTFNNLAFGQSIKPWLEEHAGKEGRDWGWWAVAPVSVVIRMNDGMAADAFKMALDDVRSKCLTISVGP